MSPAVNVDLEEVPFAILEAVKARILANRRRLDQALTKPRVPTRPRPQFRKVGANSKSWRLPQHGAAVLGDPTTFGHVPYHFTYYSDRTWTVRIWSGDFSTSIDYNISSREEQDLIGTSFFILPVDGQTCILVTMQRVRRLFPGPPAQYEDVAFADRAALCTLTSVRELAIPGPLSFITGRLNPKNGPAGEQEITIDGYTQFPPFQLRGNGIAEGWIDFGGFGEYNWSPSIFGVLQRISPFVPLSAIQQTPPDRPPVVKLNYYIDERYENWFSLIDGSVRYAEWRGDPDEFDQVQVDQWTEIDSARWFMPPDFSVPPYTYRSNVWDWDDPDYCRAMCNALGFTDADLTP